MTELFLLLLIAFSSAAFAQYEVQLAPGTQQLSVTLQLPAGSKPAKLAPRGTSWGLKPQVSDVRCADDSLPQDKDGNWIAPASCPAVTWRVVPDRVPVEGVDASKQRTLVLGQPSWFLLAEPTSLLRPQGSLDATTIRAAQGSLQLTGATSVRAGTFRVPAINSGPEFYVLGQAEFSNRRLGELEVTYVADDPARVKRLELEALHAKALDYLLGVVPLPRSASLKEHSLLVVWLGVDESRGAVGGAAGSRSFLANYVLGSSANEGRNTALTMMIVAHEQFHQLVDMVHGDLPSRPSAVWLNESLAHYYGLKALIAADKSQSAKDVWATFIDPERTVEHGLLELNRRYESGDRTVYNLFYSQGATFWHAIDTAIQVATHNDGGLDAYVGDLLRAQVADGGALPNSFTDQLRRVGGVRIDQILSKYVGE